MCSPFPFEKNKCQTPFAHKEQMPARPLTPRGEVPPTPHEEQEAEAPRQTEPGRIEYQGITFGFQCRQCETPLVLGAPTYSWFCNWDEDREVERHPPDASFHCEVCDSDARDLDDMCPHHAKQVVRHFVDSGNAGEIELWTIWLNQPVGRTAWTDPFAVEITRGIYGPP